MAGKKNIVGKEKIETVPSRESGGWMGTFVKLEDQCSWMTVGKMRRKRSQGPI